jgi:hypothetical protein
VCTLPTSTSPSHTSYVVTHHSMLYTTNAVDTTNQSVLSDRFWGVVWCFYPRAIFFLVFTQRRCFAHTC